MMTSKEVAKCDAVENRRRSPLDHLPPPANSNKPLTPFSIEDILNKPSVKRSYTICGTAHLISSSEKHRPSSIPLSSRALLTQTSPLCALEELASKTFKGLEVSVLQAAEGTAPPPNYTHWNSHFSIQYFVCSGLNQTEMTVWLRLVFCTLSCGTFIKCACLLVSKIFLFCSRMHIFPLKTSYRTKAC